MIPGIEYTWSSMDLAWNEIYFFYNEPWIISEISEIISRGGSHRKKGRPLDPEIKKEIIKKIGEKKTKQFIKLVCVVNGKKFSHEKELDDIDISITDIETTIKEVEKRIKIMK